jgi:hypothetical protein
MVYYPYIPQELVDSAKKNLPLIHKKIDNLDKLLEKIDKKLIKSGFIKPRTKYQNNKEGLIKSLSEGIERKMILRKNPEYSKVLEEKKALYNMGTVLSNRIFCSERNRAHARYQRRS